VLDPNTGASSVALASLFDLFIIGLFFIAGGHHLMIQTLARSRTVSFLLGSRTSEEGEIHFPHWDVLAMAEIQKRITQMELPVRINIQDVPMGQDEVPVDLESHFEQPGQSLVCLGSHRLMSTSSLMLERMFGLDATPERRPRLPFAIVWNEALHRLESPFRRSAVEIEVSHPDAAAAVRQQNGGSVLVAGEDAWIDTLTARGRGHGYGVFAYLKGYRFKVRSTYTFAVPEGRISTLYVVGYEKGGPTTPLEERPAVRYIERVERQTRPELGGEGDR